MELRIWKNRLSKYRWEMMFLLCFVISESALASSCKVDLGASVESYESENCIEKENYWIVQSCSTKLFCKVTNKDLVKTHKYKCPKSTGNPKLSCFTFPKTKFNSSAFKIISVDDIKELSKIEKHSSGFVFYVASPRRKISKQRSILNQLQVTNYELLAAKIWRRLKSVRATPKILIQYF
jgi:hypothetical protein